MSVGQEKAADQDFRALGLSPNASRTEVKRAYRDLVRRWHPDHFQQHPEAERRQAEERLKTITGAYRRISQSWVSKDECSSVRREKPDAPDIDPSGRNRSARGTAASDGRRARERQSRTAGRKPLGPLFRQRAVYFFLAFLCLTALVVINLLPLRESSESESQMLDRGQNFGLQLNSRQLPQQASATASAHAEINKGKALPARKAALDPHKLAPAFSPMTYFSLGSSQDDVLRVQGVPDKIHSQTWIYGLSEVHFKDHRVDRYNNFDGTLKVRLLPLQPAAKVPAFFTLGSTKNEVIAIQGTPTRILGRTWYYGFSTIRFKDGRVKGFDNFFGNLKIRMLPSARDGSSREGRFFTIGSTADEVLAVQGTPTRVQGHTWFYHFSNILFRHGKVKYVFDSSGNLRFISPPG